MRHPKLAWLDLLQQTGAIESYTIESIQEQDGVLDAAIRIRLVGVEKKVEFRADGQSSKLSMELDTFLQQLDEDQGLT